jgi:glucuronate isomerase
MKNLILLPLLVLFCAKTSFAQPKNPESRKSKIEAYRIAFFTEKLSLNEQEAQTFWPIMNEFRDARQKLHEQFGASKDIDSMTDSEVEKSINNSIELDQKELDLKKDLLFKMRKVLPARKVARLQGIEREFKEELLKKIRKKEARVDGGANKNGEKNGRRNR